MNGYQSNYPMYYQNYPNYQQQMPQPMMQQQQYVPTMQNVQTQNAPNQILAWVQSEEDANNFPLNAGQSIFLMNQKQPYLYCKSVDQLGKVTFIKQRLVDETEKKRDTEQFKDFIRREELENLISDKIRAEIEKRISEISFKPTNTKKREDER